MICQFLGCNNHATRVIPVLIGPCEEPSEIHVCEQHFRDVVFDYKCSCEIINVKEVAK